MTNPKLETRNLNQPRNLPRVVCVACCFLLSALCFSAFSQSSAFTYQGRLDNGGPPVTGSYDLRFALYDAANAGTVQGSALTNAATAVRQGLFTVTLDFGNQFPGADRWLELGVRTNGGGAFTPLAPRLPLTPTPYAVRAGSANSVAAANITGTLPLAQLPPAVITNGASALNLSGTFSGSFGGVTNLNLSTASFGSGVNRFRFTDTAGSQQILLHAGRNLDLETINDATFWVGHDYFATVDYDSTVHVKHDASVAVDNNLSALVGASLSLGIGAGLDVTANNLSLVANQNATVTVVNNLSTTVGTGMSLDVGNSLSVTAGSGLTLSAGNSMAFFAPGGVGISTGNPNAVALTVSGSAKISGSLGVGTLDPQGVLEIQGGADSFGNNDGRSLALAYRFGGYRHWLRTRHNSAAALGNAIDFFVNTGNTASASTAPGTNNVLGLSVNASNGGSVGIGTASPQGNLHIYSANNPTVVRLQSTGTPGAGRLEFVSNPQGDVNEWRPGYIQSTDSGGFTGGLAFFVNGSGSGSKFGSNEVMRIQNGRVGIGTTAPTTLLQVGSATCNGTTWVNASDRNAKQTFQPVDVAAVLEKVATLPLSQWSYKADPTLRHLGPMAQDFYAAFNVGPDDKHIATVDADGVALAAIQGLNEKVEGRSRLAENRMNQLETENAALKLRLERLEKLFTQRQ